MAIRKTSKCVYKHYRSYVILSKFKTCHHSSPPPTKAITTPKTRESREEERILLLSYFLNFY